jgi:hypothetical protein
MAVAHADDGVRSSAEVPRRSDAGPSCASRDRDLDFAYVSLELRY